ncbi:MAG: ribosome maturation factor RimP [Alphaproteobacteria bacterium]|nr:ribosome maturation factor RimP [Alphaproteobacteria bacterium]
MQLEKINDLIKPSIEALGYSLVRTKFQGNHRPTLQIMIERQDDQPISVEDCTSISYALSALLDVHNPINEQYTLEISSPGINRPLVYLNDFKKFAGLPIQIETKLPVDGKKRFQGRLIGIKDEIILLEIDQEVKELSFSNINKSHLVLLSDHPSLLPKLKNRKNRRKKL